MRSIVDWRYVQMNNVNRPHILYTLRRSRWSFSRYDPYLFLSSYALHDLEISQCRSQGHSMKRVSITVFLAASSTSEEDAFTKKR